MVEQHDDDDDWGNVYLTETSAHYFTQVSWDYFQNLGRAGLDGNSGFLQVRTQYNANDARFNFDDFFFPVPRITLGKINNFDYAWEPSIVAHEFTHGITAFTAELENEFEPGALNESFSDIFGLDIQAKMLDNNSTDWIIGNNVTSLFPFRSFNDPNSDGLHFSNYDVNNNPVFGSGQPDTYLGTYYYNGTDANVNSGGVHINSGVQNHWFYILSAGDADVNDLGNSYNVQGIGRDKAIQISFLALTSFLQSSSQYVDSRLATIQAAEQLFGTCSQEHRSTIDAWYAVGLGLQNSCPPLSIDEIVSDVKIYPNPSSQHFVISSSEVLQIDKVSIFDLNGKLVDVIDNYKVGNVIDISTFANGIYQVEINIENTISTKKLVVSK